MNAALWYDHTRVGKKGHQSGLEYSQLMEHFVEGFESDWFYEARGNG